MYESITNYNSFEIYVTQDPLVACSTTVLSQKERCDGFNTNISMSYYYLFKLVLIINMLFNINKKLRKKGKFNFGGIAPC